jgi:hypothetical protein
MSFILKIVITIHSRLSTALSPLADNVPAAWRSGGFTNVPAG